MQELQDQEHGQEEQDATKKDAAANHEHDAADADKASKASGAVVQKKKATGDGAGKGGEDKVAQEGVAGGGGPLPHQAQIQKSFGHHDVSGVQAHVGGNAGNAAKQIGAEAYATGNSVAFQGQPDLHTAAHEAAHVVQQKGGVSKKAAVGGADDAHEQEADKVADKVVAGESAAPLLDQAAKGSGGDHEAVQHKKDDKKKAPPAAPPPTDNAAALSEKAHAIESILHAAYTDCDAHAAEWVGAADKTGTCYLNAYNQHENVRKQQEASDQLKMDLLFAVLNIATSGVLGGLMKSTAVGKVLQGKPEWLVESIGGVVDAAGGELFGGGVTDGTKPKVALPSVSADPLQFHLDMKNVINTHIIGSKQHLNGQVQKIKDVIVTKNYDSIKNVDVVSLDAKVKEWKATKVLFRSPKPIPEASLTTELEKGMWAKWVQTLKSKQKRYAGEMGEFEYEVDAYKSPGGIVEKHLTKLTGQNFDFGWYTSDAEVERLFQWGAAFKPPVFDLG